jgi:ribosomal protein S18 acetylase RimI-like enzyme
VGAFEETSADPVGFLCSGDAALADRVFELYWIFTAPGAGGRGVGRRLMAHFDATARARGMRMAVIHTSGRPEYEPARRLYLSFGFREVARVRDYYRAGDDLVVFGKAYP